MFLKKVSLLNFKNISQADIEFDDEINCFVGGNGAGKTNIIDSVYYLSMCKSSFTMTDGQCARHGENFFVIDGDYVCNDGGREKISCSFKRLSGKVVKRNGKEYERLSEHIGVIPVVIVSPSDVFLVNDAAEERRRWLNSAISQLDRNYLTTAIRYNHILGQRNCLLKQSLNTANRELLEVFDAQMVELGEVIHSARKIMIERLQPIVENYYKVLSGDSEKIELSYRSELNNKKFAELLADARQKDIVSRFSTSGIHRDDMVMTIGDYPLKKYGSQGQQKSFLIALKLAQYSIISQERDEKPILLLDDLFDKLDTSRLEQLIMLTQSEHIGQTIISDCNRSRLVSVLDNCGVKYTLFEVCDGGVTIDKR